MSISVLNTDAGLSGKTIVNAEDAQTVTGLKTYDRDPNPPFAVTAGSAVVANLDADKVDGYEAAALAVLAENETVTGTWSFNAAIASNAALNLNSGQINFPAAQSASSSANCLDDYEEGTWTPVIGGSGGTSGQTYSVASGFYVKVGKLVTAQFNIVLSNKGTITTNVQIQGLPFTIENTAGYAPPLKIGYWTNMTSSFVFLGGQGTLNTTTATVQGATAAATGLTTLVTGDLSNTTSLIGEITYRATA